jgi:hypothetical protein
MSAGQVFFDLKIWSSNVFLIGGTSDGTCANGYGVCCVSKSSMFFTLSLIIEGAFEKVLLYVMLLNSNYKRKVYVMDKNDFFTQWKG